MFHSKEMNVIPYNKNDIRSILNLSNIDKRFVESLELGLVEVINFVESFVPKYEVLDGVYLNNKVVRCAPFKFISAIFVIGSIASKECAEDSDIDIVIILNNEELSYNYEFRNLIHDLHKKYEKRLQVIPISVSSFVDYHMLYKTTMYHSILKGLELYNDGVIQKEKVCSVPALKWLIEWYLSFSRVYRYGLEEVHIMEEYQDNEFIGDDLARSFFNFCIIYIELVYGVVPTTKKQVVAYIDKYRPDLIKYLRLAVNIRKKRVNSTLRMAKQLLEANRKIKKDILKVYRIIRNGEANCSSLLKFLWEYY